MFDKVQESLKKSKDERQKKRLEKERVRLEKAAAEAVREKERLQQEAEKIQAEKDRLLSLDDKGLMVELILAVRGHTHKWSTFKVSRLLYPSGLTILSRTSLPSAAIFQIWKADWARPISKTQ